MRDMERRFAEGVLGPVIMPPEKPTPEVLALRARVKRLEDAIRKAIDFGDGHAWWDSEGNAKIESGGHKLLKETLDATS